MPPKKQKEALSDEQAETLREIADEQEHRAWLWAKLSALFSLVGRWFVWLGGLSLVITQAAEWWKKLHGP